MKNISYLFTHFINFFFTLIITLYSLTSLYLVSFKKFKDCLVIIFSYALETIIEPLKIIHFFLMRILESIYNHFFYSALVQILCLLFNIPFQICIQLLRRIIYPFILIINLFYSKTSINNQQSSHTASVHESASKSAMELSKKYGKAIEGEIAIELVEMLKNDISNLTSNDFVSEQQISAAIRCIDRLKNPEYTYTDPKAEVSIIQLLALTYEAAKDENYRNNTLQNYLEAITLGLYEIQRGYNQDQYSNDDNLNDYPICPGGAFNKLIEKMVGILPDCSMVFINAESINIKLLSLIRANINNTFKYPGKITIDNKNLFIKSYGLKNGLATIKYLHYNDESIFYKIQKNIKKSLNDEFGDALGQYILKNNYTIHQYIEEGIDQEEDYLFEILNDELVEKFKENEHINNQISEKNNFLNGYNIFVFILIISFVVAITSPLLAPYFVASTLINIAIAISLISLYFFVEGLFNKRISSAFFNKEISFFETILLSCVHLNYNLNLFQILSLKKEQSITFEQLLRFNSRAKDALEIERIKDLFINKNLSFEELNQLDVNGRLALEMGNIRALFINKQLSFEQLFELNKNGIQAIQHKDIQKLFFLEQLTLKQLNLLGKYPRAALYIEKIRNLYIEGILPFDELLKLNLNTIDYLNKTDNCNLRSLFISKHLTIEQLKELNIETVNALKNNTIKDLFKDGYLTVEQLKEIDPNVITFFKDKNNVDGFKNKLYTFDSIKNKSFISNFNPQTLFGSRMNPRNQSMDDTLTKNNPFKK